MDWEHEADDEEPEMEVLKAPLQRMSSETGSEIIEAPDAVLMGYLAFEKPKHQWLAFVVPKDREAWLEYLLHLLKRKITITYLSDKELKKVITRARPNLRRKTAVYTIDPDAPECIEWTKEQVADWIELSGYPHLRNAFLINYINGRRLISVDASALCKMGIKDFDEIQEVTALIRELLGIHRSNILRAIMRRVPFELYLKRRYKTGRTYDMLSFKSFCAENGYPYMVLRTNKNALIPCTVGVVVTRAGYEHDREHEGSETSDAESDDASLKNAPSVEFVIRHQIVRRRTIDAMIKAMVDCVFDPACHHRIGLKDSMQGVLGAAFSELGISDISLYTKERVEFATEMAQALIQEMQKTAEVLRDINKLKQYLRDEATPEQVEVLKDSAEAFIEEVSPIAALMALQEFTLESVFKQEPEFEEYVDSIITKAEEMTNDLVPDATAIVNEIINEAKVRILNQFDFPNLDVATVRSAHSLALQILDDLLDETDAIVREAHADYDYVPGDDDDEDVVGVDAALSSPSGGLGPNMYIQGGKLFMKTNDLIGRVGADGVVRDIDDGQVLARVDEAGNVLGLNGERYGKIGKKADVAEFGRPRTHSHAFRMGLVPTLETEDGRVQVQTVKERQKVKRIPLPKKLSHATLTSMADMTKNAVNKAILNLVREGAVRKLISGDGKLLIGHIEKDGRLVNETGVTLGYLQTNGTIVAADGTEFKTAGILLDGKADVIGTLSQGRIRLPENIALEKIKTDDAKQAWAALKTGSPKHIITPNGTNFYIGADGVLKNSIGAVVGVLTKDGKFEMRSGKSLPVGTVLVGADEKVMGTVEDGLLKILVKTPFDRVQRILDTLKNLKSEGKQDNMLVYDQDGKTLIATLTPAGTMVNTKGEVLAQLQLDGTFKTPDSQPLNRRLLILSKSRALLAKVNQHGQVSLVEDSPENFAPIEQSQLKKIMQDVKEGHKHRLVSNDHHFLASISPNSTLISEDYEVVGRIVEAKLIQNDGTPFDGLILGSRDQVVATVVKGELKVPRRYSMDIYTKMVDLMKTPETRKLYSKNDQVIGELTKDLRVVNRGQEIARLLPDGYFIQSKDKKLFRQPGTIRGVDLRVLATINENGQVEIPTDVAFEKVKPAEAEKLLESLKDEQSQLLVFNSGQTSLIGTMSPEGHLVADGAIIGRLMANGVLKMTSADEQKFPFGLALVRNGQVIGRVQPNEEVKLVKDPEKPDDKVKNRIGNAFRFISEDGKKLVGEITPAMQLVNKGRIVAEVHATQNKFVLPNDEPLRIPGILLRSDGRVVGRVTAEGEIVLGTQPGHLDKVKAAEVEEALQFVTHGDKKKLVSKEGQVLATIELDGTLLDPADGVTSIGQVAADGNVYKPDGSLFTAGLIVNQLGQLVGRVKETGGIKLLTEQEQEKIQLAKIHMQLKEGTGHTEIFSEDGKKLVGVLQKEGRVVKHSITVADLHPDMRMVQADGEHMGTVSLREDGKLVLKAAKTTPKQTPPITPTTPTPQQPDDKTLGKDVKTFWRTVKQKGQIRYISDSLNEYIGDLKLSGDLVHGNEVVGKLSPDRKLMQMDGRPYKGGYIATNDGQIFAQVDTQGGVALLSKKSTSAVQAEKIKTVLLKAGGQHMVNSEGNKMGKLTHEGNLVHEKRVIGQLDPGTSRFVQPDGSAFEHSGVLKSPDETSVVGHVDKGDLKLVLPGLEKVKSDELKAVMAALSTLDPKELVDETDHENIGTLTGTTLMDAKGDVLGQLNEYGQIIQEDTGKPLTQGLIFGPDNKLLGKIGEKGVVRLMSMKDYEQNKADEVWDSVRAGDAQRIFSPDGKEFVAEITADGIVHSRDMMVIGKLKHNGHIMLNNNTPMDPGLVLRADGAVIGSIEHEGKVKLKDVNEFLAIGTVLHTGQIMSTSNHPVAQIVADGRVFQDGKMVAFMSPEFELLTPNGMAFAKAAPSGTLYHMDIIHQPDYVPPKLPLPDELLDQHKHKSRGIHSDGPESNTLEDELLRIANKEPHHTQRYHHRFNRVVGKHGTRIMGEDLRHRVQFAEGELTQHDAGAMTHAVELAAKRLLPHTTGAEILEEIQGLRKAHPEEREKETDAERIRRMAKERSMHRRSMIDRWAMEQEEEQKADIVLDFPEGSTDADKKRIVRMTADAIVADILQMALTNVLFNAEAGHNTEKSMAALKHIQVQPGSLADDSQAQIMWTPHLPSSYVSHTHFHRGHHVAKSLAYNGIVDGLRSIINSAPTPTRRSLDYETAPAPVAKPEPKHQHHEQPPRKSHEMKVIFKQTQPLPQESVAQVHNEPDAGARHDRKSIHEPTEHKSEHPHTHHHGHHEHKSEHPHGHHEHKSEHPHGHHEHKSEHPHHGHHEHKSEHPHGHHEHKPEPEPPSVQEPKSEHPHAQRRPTRGDLQQPPH